MNFASLLRWRPPALPPALSLASVRTWLVCAGVLAIVWALAALAQSQSAASAATLLLIAPMAASALLLLLRPDGPFTTLWAVAGGYTVSAAVGVSAARWIGDLPLACAVAASAALLAMLALRCAHAPGAAVAVMPVLAGAALRAEGYRFVPLAALGALLVLLLASALKRVLPQPPAPH